MSLLCQRCIWILHPLMLTTYCIPGTCPRCGRLSDLAIVKPKEETVMEAGA
jgi:hypothetical protein